MNDKCFEKKETTQTKLPNTFLCQRFAKKAQIDSPYCKYLEYVRYLLEFFIIC